MTTAKQGVGSQQPRRCGRGALVVSCLFVAVQTLLPQADDPPRVFDLCILCGSYGTTNLILNSLLFVPLGASLAIRKRSFSAALFLCAAATVCIELLQLLAIPGRFATLGDILSNVAGGAIGWQIVNHGQMLTMPTPRQGLFEGLTIAGAMVVFGYWGGWLFEPSPTASPYYGQVAPEVRERGAVDGVVSGQQVNGQSFSDGPLLPALMASVTSQLHAREAALEADLSLRNAKLRATTVVRIVDENSEDIMFIALLGTDAFFSLRTRAADLRLQQPVLFLRNAFRCDSCVDGLLHNKTRVVGARDGPHYTLQINSGGIARSNHFSLSTNMTWIAVSPVVVAEEWMHQVTAVWLACPALLLGYWLSFGYSNRRWRWIAMLCPIFVIALTQLAVPISFGLPLASAIEWIALTAALSIGAAVGAIVRAKVRLPHAQQGTSLTNV